MKYGHLISDELFTQAMKAFDNGSQFVVYNEAEYLLDSGNMQFFKEKWQAVEFITDNVSDRDYFRYFKANSLMDIYDHFEIEQSLRQHPGILSHLKHITMEENNFEYLEKQLRYSGFGENHGENLKAQMSAGQPEFTLQHEAKYGKDATTAIMHFRKSDEKEMYFFNSFDLKLTGNDGDIERKFYINNKQDNITLKEAYNLLSGRAIEKEITPKEGEKYKAWLQLDFKETDTNGQYKTKQFHPNYGFDLDKAVHAHAFKELLHADDKKILMESLQRGNRQLVTLEAEGKAVRLYIEAAPQFKSLNYYDSNMKQVNLNELVNSGEKQQENKKESVKQAAAGGDGETEGGTKRKRVRKPSM